MDPITILTTAASIVGTAIKLSKTLYGTVEALKDAPSDVRALCSTVDSIKSAVSRLVGFMNDDQKIVWPDQWLEDVMKDVEAIGRELEEVHKLVEDWNGTGKGGKIKDTWRNWKWHFNAEETQKCTRRLREAKEDLGFQVNTIQLSTTAQTNQDVNEVKHIIGSIKAELIEKRGAFSEQALKAEISTFAKQMSSLQEAICGLNNSDINQSGNITEVYGPPQKFRIDSPQNMSKSRGDGFTGHRNTFESTDPGKSFANFSTAADLNQQSFLQNQQISGYRLSSTETPINTAALGLKLANMSRKHDELIIQWDNAMRQIVKLENELEQRVANNLALTGNGERDKIHPSHWNQENEIQSRESVIDVLKAQNISLQTMISERVTIMGYTDDQLDARSLGKQLLKQNKKANRQQEEIDLLNWRLEGERSSLREQLRVNKILDHQVKLLKSGSESIACRQKDQRRPSNEKLPSWLIERGAVII